MKQTIFDFEGYQYYIPNISPAIILARYAMSPQSSKMVIELPDKRKIRITQWDVSEHHKPRIAQVVLIEEEQKEEDKDKFKIVSETVYVAYLVETKED
jgi:hypothetical protein